MRLQIEHVAASIARGDALYRERHGACARGWVHESADRDTIGRDRWCIVVMRAALTRRVRLI
jgi:hypothetical protein